MAFVMEFWRGLFGMNELEKFDKLKTKVLKYALYKKRSESEIRRKFAEYSGKMLDEVIDNLKENGYIDTDDFSDFTPELVITNKINFNFNPNAKKSLKK